MTSKLLIQACKLIIQYLNSAHVIEDPELDNALYNLRDHLK
jgi:hypothetical protein